MPSTDTLPVVGAIRSATIRSSVDFPQPEGPSRLRNPPRSTENETFSRAVTVRRSVMNRIVTLRQAAAGAVRDAATATGASASAAATGAATGSAQLRPALGRGLQD